MILTDRDLEEFNIDKFIDKSLKLDESEMLLRCLNFGILIQRVNPRPHETSRNKEIVTNFTRFIIHLQLIITKHQEVVKPIGMSKDNFFKVKPIVEKLVASGYLKKDWLELYIPLF
jgi:hypothetical protein